MLSLVVERFASSKELNFVFAPEYLYPLDQFPSKEKMLTFTKNLLLRHLPFPN